MISERLRTALGAAAIMVIFGGPILAVLGFLGLSLDDDVRGGVAFGVALNMFFGSLIGGGILRLLVSIDARLEARA